MKKIIFLILCLFYYLMQPVAAQMPDSVKLFIDSALNIMQKNSIFAKGLDWNEVRDHSFNLASNASTYEETAPALQYAFNSLGDKHGWLVLNNKGYRNTSFTHDTSRITDDIKKAAKNGARIYRGVIENKYAYLSIPFFGAQTKEEMDLFAQRLQDSLCKSINSQTKGIIIDLRLNAGGNMFPMLVGICNLLGDGIVFESKDSKGNTIGKTAIQDHSMTIIDTLTTELRSNCGDLTRYPVAVIIGPVTGSAGECVAVAMRGRPRTKLFGEETAGYTSGNQGYLLPGQDNGIVIGVDFLHDRNSKEYRESVRPDIVVNGGDAFFDHANDRKIKAAVYWLKRQ
jgi:C-terminal processing protease CtpA/Prc